MKPALLHLTDYFITDLHLSANSKFDSNQEMSLNFDDFKATLDLAKAPAENNRSWQIILKLQHQPPAEANVPYRFAAEIVGLFVVVDAVPEDYIDKLVRTNGPSMLYGILREVIRDTTARGPYSPILLPSTSFYERELPATATETVQPETARTTKRKSSVR
jgi:preprotein translocase subunit SecB